jgi:hypothetical protein
MQQVGYRIQWFLRSTYLPRYLSIYTGFGRYRTYVFIGPILQAFFAKPHKKVKDPVDTVPYMRDMFIEVKKVIMCRR